MPKAEIIAIFIILVLPVSAQSFYEQKSYAHPITLSHDTDFFLLSDYYYCSGLFSSYPFILKNFTYKKL